MVSNQAVHLCHIFHGNNQKSVQVQAVPGDPHDTEDCSQQDSTACSAEGRLKFTEQTMETLVSTQPQSPVKSSGEVRYRLD